MHEYDPILKYVNPDLAQRAAKILQTNSELRGEDYLRSKIKAILDYSVAIPASTVTLPIMLGGGLAVFFLDGHWTWPYVDVGNKNIAGMGKGISFWKIRTMVPNAREIESEVTRNTPLIELKRTGKDPRVTTIGKFLRKTSWDETPQLLNVLRRDVTLVGVRQFSQLDLENRVYPNAESEPYKSFLDQIYGGKVRYGVTGFYEIMGRSCLETCDWVGLEVAYTRGANLKADLRIIAATFPALLSRKGAG